MAIASFQSSVDLNPLSIDGGSTKTAQLNILVVKSHKIKNEGL